MHRTFESWLSDFSFSDELSELEKSLTLPLDAAQGEAESPTPPSPDVMKDGKSTTAENIKLERFTRLFARYVTETMAEKITQQPYLARLVRAEDLKRDNQILAEQVKHLLKEKKDLEENLKAAERLQKSYKRIVGNLYLKLE